MTIAFNEKMCLDLEDGHLDEWTEEGYAEKCAAKANGNVCKVISYSAECPGVNDYWLVLIQMEADGRQWNVPARMLSNVNKNEAYMKDARNRKYGHGHTLHISSADLGCASDHGYKYVYKYGLDRNDSISSMCAGIISNVPTPRWTFSYDPYFIRVKKILYNDPATIVFWKDGSKTVVKRAKNETFNPYTAFCAALAKKIYGNNSRVNRLVKSGVNQLTGRVLKDEDIPKGDETFNPYTAFYAALAKKKDEDIPKGEKKDASAAYFVRDEKGRWVSVKNKTAAKPPKKEKKKKG